ncbi:MAG TPA: hypothetical protein PKK43_10855, partial [Spirochaetota bacterium]|nr:hypothetical protein [Spirochaetota bacterium]
MTGELVEIDENGFIEYPSYMPDSPPFKFREARITGNYHLLNTTSNVVDRLVMFPVPNIFMEGISDFKAEVGGRKTEFTCEKTFKTRRSSLFFKEAFSEHSLQVMSKFQLIIPCDIDPKMISLEPIWGNVPEIRRKLEAVKGMSPEDREEIFKSIMDELYRAYAND